MIVLNAHLARPNYQLLDMAILLGQNIYIRCNIFPKIFLKYFTDMKAIQCLYTKMLYGRNLFLWQKMTYSS